MKIMFNNIESSSNNLDDITEAIYACGSDEIRNYYTIHVNFVDDEWVIDCDPKHSELPVIKLVAYETNINSDKKSILKIEPQRLDKFPSSITFNSYNACMDTANSYIDVMDFLISLYDFEYEL